MAKLDNQRKKKEETQFKQQHQQIKLMKQDQFINSLHLQLQQISCDAESQLRNREQIPLVYQQVAHVCVSHLLIPDYESQGIQLHFNFDETHAFSSFEADNKMSLNYKFLLQMTTYICHQYHQNYKLFMLNNKMKFMCKKSCNFLLFLAIFSRYKTQIYQVKMFNFDMLLILFILDFQLKEMLWNHQVFLFLWQRILLDSHQNQVHSIQIILTFYNNQNNRIQIIIKRYHNQPKYQWEQWEQWEQLLEEPRLQRFVQDKYNFLQIKQKNMREEFRQKQKIVKEFVESFQIISDKIQRQFETDISNFEKETQQLIDHFQEPYQIKQHYSDFQLYSENYQNDSSITKKKIQKNIEKFENFLDRFKNEKQQILPAINRSGKITIEKQCFYIPFEVDPKYYKFAVNKDGTYLAYFDLTKLQIMKQMDLSYKHFKELDVGTSVNCIKFGTDNTLYVGEDEEILIWKFEDDNWEKQFRYIAHNRYTINEIIVDTKETIYSCGDDKSVEVRQKVNDTWRKNDNLKIKLNYLLQTIKINARGNLLAAKGFSRVSIFQKTYNKWETVKIFHEKNILNFEFLRDNLACMQFQDQIRFYSIQGETFFDNHSIVIQIKNMDLKTPFIWSQGLFIMNQTDNKFSVAGLVNDSLQVMAQLDGQLEYVQISENKNTMISLNYKDRMFQFYKIALD